jgi:hypothetical protein
MLIQAYRVESRRPPLLDGKPLTPVLVGTVQFTGGIEEGSTENARKRVAIDLLLYRSHLADHSTYGRKTWKAELTTVDDDTLGTPSVEDASEGYRIWLPS